MTALPQTTAPTETGPQFRALPDHTQLPDKDGAPVRNSHEPWQSKLLCDTLEPTLRQRHPDGNYFIGQDCGIYWRHSGVPQPRVKSPDWYYVPDVPRLLDGELRRSYVLWQEEVAPFLILEYASDHGSEERDTTPNEGKFWVYERRIRPAYYGIYEVDPGRVEMYQLFADHFQRMQPNQHDRYLLPALGVEIGIWTGEYAGFHLPWLRWWDTSGNLLPTLEDRTEQERQHAEQEHQRAEQEHQRAEQEHQRAEQERLAKEVALQRAALLAEKLRSLGIDPDQL